MRKLITVAVSGMAILRFLVSASAQTPVNQKPSVNAGPDQTINLPGGASLSGTISDDGLPGLPAVLQQGWFKYSGPGTVTFGTPSQLTTTATFSSPGTYVLYLAAHDGALLGYDFVTNTVTAFDRLTPNWQPGQMIPNFFAVQHHGDNGGAGDWLPQYSSIATISINHSGNWSEIFGRTPPNAGDVVLIPPGVDVVYDVQSTVALRAVVVQGSLTMASHLSTTLAVGTIFVEQQGAFTAVPNNNSVKTVVLFSGQVNTAEDPAQASIGLVAFGGTIQVGGTPRTALSPSSNATQGARVITVQNATDWLPGDFLIFPDQQPNADPTWWNFPNVYVPQTERIKIVAVNGNQITLETALRYNHSVGGVSLVAMVSRNVAFMSDLAAGRSRAHIFFGGHTSVTFKHAMLVDMGRTTVAERDDAKFDSSGQPTHVGQNQRGRYTLHAHHVHETVTFEGNSIFGFRSPYGSERLGIVIHNSRGDVRANVVVGARGSGIFLEDGVETGQVVGNLIIGAGGGSGLGDDIRFASFSGQDMGSGGFAIWARGPLVLIKDNIATGYFSRAAYGYFVHPSFVSALVPDIAGTPPEIIGQRLVISKIPIQQYGGFDGNLAYGIFPIALDFDYSSPTEANVFKNFRVKAFGTSGFGLNVIHCSKLRFENPQFVASGGGTAIYKHNGVAAEIDILNGVFANWSNAINTFPAGNLFTAPRFQNNDSNITVLEGSGDVVVRNYNGTGIDYQLYENASEVPGTPLDVLGIEGFALRIN